MRNELDELLKHALTPIDEPDARLNQSIINQVKEQESMKKRIWKRIPAAALVAAIVIGCTSLTVAAGVVVKHYLSARDVVERSGDTKLLDAFSGGDEILINETQSYGGYDVTLLGIVSGKNISKYIASDNGRPLEDRTYVLLAIANTDGTPISDEGKYPYSNFYISPLVRGFNPLFLNLHSLNAAMSAFYENGVRYYLIECDNVEIFADHDLYLCVCGDVSKSGSEDFDEAYQFDEATGIISRNEDYDGLNALFDLPVDASKADPEAVENYLKSDEMLADKFLGGQSGEEEKASEVEPSYVLDKHKWRHQVTPENIDTYADRIEESVQVLTPDEKGFIHYHYEDENGDILADGHTNVSSLFEAEEKFIIRGFGFSGSAGKTTSGSINTLQANDDGTVTFAYYQIKQSVLEKLESE